MNRTIINRVIAVSTAACAVLLSTFLLTPYLSKEKTALQLTSEQDAAAQSANSTVEITGDIPTVPLVKQPGVSYPLIPTRSGTSTYGNSKVFIDASNTGEGYVMIKYTGTSGKVKLQISKSGDIAYTYNLRSGVDYEVFPFTCGSGLYTINIFENVYDSQYVLAYGTTVQVSLINSYQSFLYPNQYVNFSPSSNVVSLSCQLAKDATSDIQILSNIYNYVISHFTYDDYKAATVVSGYIPVVDEILASNKGICFDYAAVMVSMLRAQAIPARLEIGYVTGGTYHAWISTYITDIGWVNNIIQFDGQNWKLMDPTFASGAKGNNNIMTFINNTTNYSAKYVY